MIGIGIAINNPYHQSVKRPPASLYFDGVDDYINCGTNYSIANKITLEAWIKTSTYTQYPRIVGIENVWMICLGPAGQEENRGLRWYGSGVDLRFPNSPDLFDGKDHHVAAVYGGNKINGYVDGEAVGSLDKTGDLNSAGNIPVTIGNNISKNRAFKGIINDVRIWNVARTQQQIQDNMNKELAGNETGLVGYWRLNEGAGNKVRDYSGNGNDGTIYGASWKY